MIIVTADDYGKTKACTDRILACYSHGWITSASAMVFMADSERAAELAKGSSLEVGLHLNFTQPFVYKALPPQLRRDHNQILSYLSRHKIFQALYHPGLSESFRYIFQSQVEEFVRLYGHRPDFYNGHHHMHLCANMLTAGLIPPGSRVRRSFTFRNKEKSIFNRLYRRLIDEFVDRRYISTDYFFSVAPIHSTERLWKIFQLAMQHSVELEVHLDKAEETNFLAGDLYRSLIAKVPVMGFRHLCSQSPRKYFEL